MVGKAVQLCLAAWVSGSGHFVACADADLESLAAAAQQLQQLETLDLGDVLVSTWLAAGMRYLRRLLCLM